MHDLATIKRLNRNPSNNRQDKLAPQPTREASREYYYAARAAVSSRRFQGVPPAGQRSQGDQ